jgi:hypothetical protein
MNNVRSSIGEFSETVIQKLFGSEAAEDEDPKRLREYYFKSSTFEQVTANLPLRILVGHKGIGKSALFKIAISEDEENCKFPILIRPDDISDIAVEDADLLKMIRVWKDGLTRIIAEKTVQSLGMDSSGVQRQLQHYGGRILKYISDTFEHYKTISSAPTKRLVAEHFLKNNAVNIYIDDLDRGWEGRTIDIRRISALLNAARDMSNENRGLHFKVGLRSDVFYLVRTSDESTDKIEGSVVWQAWVNHEILVLLVKRVETFFGRGVDEHKLVRTPQSELGRYLDCIMEPIFLGRGHWANAPIYKVLMSLIRRRPRDLVKLCTLAARRARQRNSKIIQTADFESVFEEYSQGRVQDTILEYRSELPEIERLVLNMKPNRRERNAKAGYVYTSQSLLKKLEGVRQGSEFSFRNGRVATPKELAAFLYKINFLTARKETADGIMRKYFEENRYLAGHFADFGFDWEIHPAYPWALQPDDLRDLYQELRLSSDQ